MLKYITFQATFNIQPSSVIGDISIFSDPPLSLVAQRALKQKITRNHLVILTPPIAFNPPLPSHITKLPLLYHCFSIPMSFNQLGYSPSATFGTYNNVTGDQTNTTVNGPVNGQYLSFYRFSTLIDQRYIFSTKQ